MNKKDLLDYFFYVLFIVVPTVIVLFGFFFLKPSINETMNFSLIIVLFSSLILLGIGYILRNFFSKKLRMAGWILFAFYWSSQINNFLSYDDLVNVFLCIAGIYFIFYLFYHEWLSIKRNEKVDCLKWAAGVTSIAGLIYFSIELTPLAEWLIETVAFQSSALLDFFTGNVEIMNGSEIFYNGSYAVTIIFACTAIQSMVLFLGMIIPLEKIGWKRRILGLAITLIPIYVLNLVRNVSIVYMLGVNMTSFDVAHNVIGKGGSLIALIILLFIAAKIVPEIFDEINCLISLPDRKGPLEKKIIDFFKRER